MVRSYYKNITDDQDYLDRQHDYNITFFLRNGEWLNSEVIINSWRFSLVESELQ
jgi:sRNA-binding regulator protein Hfq